MPVSKIVFSSSVPNDKFIDTYEELRLKNGIAMYDDECYIELLW